jgi:hypothetical protein
MRDAEGGWLQHAPPRDRALDRVLSSRKRYQADLTRHHDPDEHLTPASSRNRSMSRMLMQEASYRTRKRPCRSIRALITGSRRAIVSTACRSFSAATGNSGMVRFTSNGPLRDFSTVSFTLLASHTHALNRTFFIMPTSSYYRLGWKPVRSRSWCPHRAERGDACLCSSPQFRWRSELDADMNVYS